MNKLPLLNVFSVRGRCMWILSEDSERVTQTLPFFVVNWNRRYCVTKFWKRSFSSNFFFKKHAFNFHCHSSRELCRHIFNNTYVSFCRLVQIELIIQLFEVLFRRYSHQPYVVSHHLIRHCSSSRVRVKVMSMASFAALSAQSLTTRVEQHSIWHKYSSHCQSMSSTLSVVRKSGSSFSTSVVEILGERFVSKFDKVVCWEDLTALESTLRRSSCSLVCQMPQQ